MSDNIKHDDLHTDDQENVVLCEHCGRVIANANNDYAYEVQDSFGNVEMWCEDCVDSDAYYCEHCETYHTDDHGETVYTRWNRSTSEWWCDDCVEVYATRCENCDEVFADDCISEYSVYGIGWVHICDSCVEHNYYTCEDCGDLVHSDDVEMVDYDYYCPDCAANHRHGDNLNRYHHTTGQRYWLGVNDSRFAWNMTPKESKTLFIGIELETDDNDDANMLADDIAEAYNDAYVECKEDGSLSSEGVEIVSQPMTPHVHLTSPMWSDIVSIVRNHNGKSHDAGTCGLHIHLSRAAFGDDGSAYKIDRVFHRFSAQLINFSRRTSTQLHWCNINNDGVTREQSLNDRKQTWRDSKKWAGRYEAVNDTNTHTIEIRLWRGTLNMETLRATIELTTGIALVCNALTDEQVENVTWSQLKTLVHVALVASGLPCDDLASYLHRRGL